MRLQPARTEEEIRAYRASLSGRRVAVIGAGASGRACLRRLAEAGARVVLADAKPRDAMGEAVAEAEALRAAVVERFEQFDQLPDVELIVSSPGIARGHAAPVGGRAAGIEVIGTMELGYRLCPAPIIAVTGTNGKGTTCRLLSAMLAAAGRAHILAGNIGTPLAEELVHATPETPAVVEVSSFQLEGIVDFHARIATVLNVAPDHLDRHADLREYLEAKARIFANQEPGDYAIVNVDDGRVRELAESTRATRLTVADSSEGADAAVIDGEVTTALWGRREVICRADDLPLRGRHHLKNLLVAAVAARLLGVAAEAVARAARAYEPPAHHMQVVGEVSGVQYINDSKASNPAAAVADLAAMERPFVAIVGGKDKGADFAELGALLTERARAVVLIGEAAERIARALGEGARPEHAATLEQAVERAAQLAQSGDAVIMAPACSSFDMFEDYRHRGRAFGAAVRRLAEEATR
ncbi:MAG TPA: UDP-N-acetylmuramoyl-L-alanine--D-glutamate ligase [Thioalkalivibrio sp.]|nr:UDP-N-acetylmuramoyl-L-alanine--D-glutamate ligase [Thioalkalivibrio sp.]